MKLTQLMNSFDTLTLTKLEEYLAQPDVNLNSRYRTRGYHPLQGETLLTAACLLARVDIVTRLLEEKNTQGDLKLDIDYPSLDSQTGERTTPLICAVENDRLEIAKLLLVAGADPNVEKNGQTAMMIAEDANKPKMITLLRQKGADIRLPAPGSPPKRRLSLDNLPSLEAFRLSLTEEQKRPPTPPTPMVSSVVILEDPESVKSDISPRKRSL